MTTRQISEMIEDIYGFEVSEGMVSDITDKLLPRIEEWQNRPLSSVYPIVFIDAVHFSVRDDGVIRKLAAYVVLPVEHPAQMEYVPYQRMIHTSVIRLLPVGSKGNGICHLLLILFMSYLQCIKKTGGRRCLLLHRSRQSRSFVTIRTDLKWHCSKRLHSGAAGS